MWRTSEIEWVRSAWEYKMTTGKYHPPLYKSQAMVHVYRVFPATGNHRPEHHGAFVYNILWRVVLIRIYDRHLLSQSFCLSWLNPTNQYFENFQTMVYQGIHSHLREENNNGQRNNSCMWMGVQRKNWFTNIEMTPVKIVRPVIKTGRWGVRRPSNCVGWK